MTDTAIEVTEAASLPLTLILDPEIARQMAMVEEPLRAIIRGLTVQRDEWHSHYNAQCTTTNNVRAEHEAFRRKVAEDIMTKAEEKNWCDEAEEFIDDLGLSEYITTDVDVEVSFVVAVERRGRQEPTQDDIDAAAISYIRHSMDATDWRVLNN